MGPNPRQCGGPEERFSGLGGVLPKRRKRSFAFFSLWVQARYAIWEANFNEGFYSRDARGDFCFSSEGRGVSGGVGGSECGSMGGWAQSRDQRLLSFAERE